MKLQQLLLQGMCLLRVAAQDRPVVDDSLSSSIVDYDQYSLIIDGKRLFMWSGEYHPWRIPVPELWQDIMQKIKAAGFNTFSMYTHWGWHSAADGKLDFETGAHNIHRIFEMAKDMGLYILLRPGPYINAESSAGGYPGWLLTGAYGSLRNNDTRYTDAWRPYQDYMAQLAGDYSITRGGNVILFQIENEYGEQWLNVAARTPNETAISYMELLEAAAKENGVDMPTIANAPNLGAKSWSLDYDINHVGGDTDLYAVVCTSISMLGFRRLSPKSEILANIDDRTTIPAAGVVTLPIAPQSMAFHPNLRPSTTTHTFRRPHHVCLVFSANFKAVCNQIAKARTHGYGNDPVSQTLILRVQDLTTRGVGLREDV